MQTVILHNNIIPTFSLLFSKVKKNNDISPSKLLQLSEVVQDLDINVVLADDDEDDVEIFREALEEIAPKIKISAVNDGDELLQFLKIKKNNPDLIFLDLNMPCKNGMQCLDEIRAIKELDKIPVIIYSTTINTVQVDATYQKGASLYLQKPSHFEDIKKAMLKIFSGGINSLFVQPAKANYIIKVN